MLFDPQKTAIHSRIIADFETRIVSGQWHTGFRVPTEHELALQYNCSRPTVAKALLVLEQKGMIERRKRAGTFVRRPPAHSIILQILDPASAIEARGTRHRYELGLVRRRAVRTEDARKLHMRGGQVLEIVSRHFSGARPYCLEERLINLKLLPEAEKADFAETPPSEWMINRMPWRSGDNYIGAMEADARLASALAVKLGSALLTVERYAYTGKGYLSHSMTYYPAMQQRLWAHYDTGPGPAVTPSPPRRH